MAYLQCSFYSKTLEMETGVNVILPAEGDLSRTKVVYLLHGLSNSFRLSLRIKEDRTEKCGLFPYVCGVNYRFAYDGCCGAAAPQKLPPKGKVIIREAIISLTSKPSKFLLRFLGKSAMIES